MNEELEVVRKAAVAEYQNTIAALVDRTVQLAAALASARVKIAELEKPKAAE